MKPVTKKQALEALDDMDDFSRMGVAVDAFGSRSLLLRYIKEREAARKELKRMRKAEEVEPGSYLR